MSPSPAIRKVPGLLERDLGDAVVVMTAEGKELHTLKGTALLLWQGIDGVRRDQELVSLLMAEYEVEEARAQADVAAFLAALSAAGLTA